MFAASARHTNAGIAARQHQMMIARLYETQKDDIKRLEDENHLLRQVAARTLAAHLPSLSPANRVIEEVARIHDIPAKDMKGPSRAAPVVAARQHAMYELRRRCPLISLPGIGRLLGGRDHTTVLHGIKAWPEKATSRSLPCLPLPEAAR